MTVPPTMVSTGDQGIGHQPMHGADQADDSRFLGRLFI
jgi:hypothetical protein